LFAGERVLGVFSHKSALDHLALDPPEGNIAARDVPVEELTEQPIWVHAHDELADVIGKFERVDALLVGAEDDLKGIVTAVDVARFYARVAQPFILLGEIERSLRGLVGVSVDAETLAERASEILADMYEGREKDLPTTLEDMTTGELVLLVRDGRFWPLLNGALGVRRENASAKLRPVPTLRNDAFQFRRALEDDELQSLQDARDWLLRLRLAAEGEE
jgi:CBS domain